MLPLWRRYRSVPGALLQQTRISSKYNTHWASLCLALDFFYGKTGEQAEMTTSAPGASQPLLPPPFRRGRLGQGYVYRAAKPLLRPEDGSFAREDTGVRLD